MALRNQPYIPLYVQDYLTDEKLNECSPATQGVYIKIMCVLHKSEKYGTILLKQKDKQSDNQITNFAYKLAKLITFNIDVIESALKELIDEHVLYIDNDFLCQKRMIKDEIISYERSKAGSKGGKKTQFAKAKIQANTENEYEDVNEIENRIVNENKTKIKKALIPNFDEFLEYAKTKEPNVDSSDLKLKYDSWLESDWSINRSGKYQKIVYWKSTLLNTLPYIKKLTVSSGPQKAQRNQYL